MSTAIAQDIGSPAFSQTTVTRLPRRFLVALYGVVPLAFAWWIADLALFHGAMRRVLPKLPDDIFALVVVFGLPHIVSSSLIFLNAEYRAHYRRQLRIGVPVIVLLVAARFVLPDIVYYPFLGIVNIKHVVGQQIALIAAFGVAESPETRAWRRLAVVTASLVGAAAYISAVSLGFLPLVATLVMSVVVVPVLLIRLVILTRRVVRQQRGREARAYTWMNVALMVGSFCFVVSGYPFLAVICPRIVHDVTAFAFYAVHNQNRSSAPGRRALWLTPLVAIAVALPFTLTRDHSAAVTSVCLGLELFHFFTESFTWKRGTLHRRYLHLG
jgi:hypothetical protein